MIVVNTVTPKRNRDPVLEQLKKIPPFLPIIGASIGTNTNASFAPLLFHHAVPPPTTPTTHPPHARANTITSFTPSRARAHTHAHTYARARTHTHMHVPPPPARSHTHTHTRARARMHAQHNAQRDLPMIDDKWLVVVCNRFKVRCMLKWRCVRRLLACMLTWAQ